MNKRKLSILIFFLTCIIPLTAQPYNRQDVNAFDRLIMNPYSPKLDTAGDILTIAALATPIVLVSTPKNQWFTEVVMYGEACLFSFGAKCLGKACVDRRRPYMYFENFPVDQVEDGDYLCSWPSAHTTMAFTGAAYTSYVFCKYFPESKYRGLVVGGSYALATGVAALRIASGNHFLTDVLTGAVIGTLSGFLVPYLHTFCDIEMSPFGLAVKFKL